MQISKLSFHGGSGAPSRPSRHSELGMALLSTAASGSGLSRISLRFGCQRMSKVSVPITSIGEGNGTPSVSCHPCSLSHFAISPRSEFGSAKSPPKPLFCLCDTVDILRSYLDCCFQSRATPRVAPLRERSVLEAVPTPSGLVITQVILQRG